MKARGGRHALVHTGVLVQADISGYTRYVSRTAIQDSSATVRELLGVLVDEVGARLEAAQFEGDSVTFVGDLRAAELVDVLEQAYVAFRRRLRDMQKCNSCDCEACARTTDLALKLIAHRGQYAWQPLGGAREQLHGSDVNASFRLLKNHVPSSEYLLLTSPLLEQLDDKQRAEYTPHVEEYEHVGRIECGFRSLAPIWQKALAAERTRVSREEARIYSEILVPSAIERTWGMFTDPESVRRLNASLRIATHTGARGTFRGAEPAFSRLRDEVNGAAVHDRALEPGRRWHPSRNGLALGARRCGQARIHRGFSESPDEAAAREPGRARARGFNPGGR